MKKFIPLMLLVVIAAALSFKQENHDRSSGTLGDVKYSILSPDKFKSANGDGWILADGRRITGSALQRMAGINRAPDARGMFLRGLNYTRQDTLGDPFFKEKGRDRVAGEYQRDLVGPHSHGWTGEAGYPGGYGYPDNAERRFKDEDLKRLPQLEKDRYVTSAQKNYSVSGVGTETRPKNIALYVYIKIN